MSVAMFRQLCGSAYFRMPRNITELLFELLPLPAWRVF
jgi:hypothetical protein